MLDVRRTLIVIDAVHASMGEPLATPIRRVAALCAIANPFAGRFAADLSPLFAAGRELGERMTPELARLLGAPATSYGKGALVGAAGEMEHGGACIHPMLGKPMRAAIGGGQAIIPSNVKLAAPGAALDVPLGHKDDVWSFDHFDTFTVAMPDGPRADEIVVAIALAAGGRPHPRCGSGPVR
jgi:hypothetical protein